MTEHLGRRSATAVLLALYGALLAVHVATLPSSPQSTLFFDEYHYWQAARDVAELRWPRYNGFWAPVFPPLYGAALAPLVATVDHADVFWWARILNAMLLGSALVPLYRLARAFAGRAPSLGVAAFAAIGAHWVYAQQLLSENLLIPLVAWAVYRTVRVAVRPTLGRAAAAGLLVGAAVLTKTLAIALVPGALLAILVVGRRRGIGAAAAWALGAAVPVALWAARAAWAPGESEALTPPAAYLEDLRRVGLRPLAEYGRWLRTSASLLVFGPGTPLLLFGIAGLVGGLRRGASRAERAVAITVGGALLGVVAEMTVFATQMSALDGNRWYYRWALERYACALWPLLALGFVTPGARRRVPLALGAVVTAALVAWAPRVFVNKELAGLFVMNFPNTYQGPTLASWLESRWLDSRLAARLALLAPTALLVPLWRGRRWPIAVAAAATVAWAVHGEVRAIGHAQRVQAGYATTVRTTTVGFDAHVRRGDVVIVDSTDDLAYLLALHFGSDFCRFGGDRMSGAGPRPKHADLAVFVPKRERVWVISARQRPRYCDVVAKNDRLYLLRPRTVTWKRPIPRP